MFTDEAIPWTEALLNRVAGGESVVVPAHQPIEVTNGLLMAVRRGRITLNKVYEFIDDLSDLPMQIEPARPLEAWPSLVALVHQHRLTTYDAAYLELAQRTGLPLATLDRALVNAARAAVVPMIEQSWQLHSSYLSPVLLGFFVDKFSHVRFGPSGWTGNQQVPYAMKLATLPNSAPRSLSHNRAQSLNLPKPTVTRRFARVRQLYGSQRLLLQM